MVSGSPPAGAGEGPGSLRGGGARRVPGGVGGQIARLFRWLVTTPLGRLLLLLALVRLIGLGWGLPSTDGWDNDGVAPRDFLAGLVETFSPGHFYTYPPVHLVVLGLLTLPVTLVALLRAPSLAPPDIISEILKPGYMTPIAYVARATTLVMSLGIAYAMAKITEEIVLAWRAVPSAGTSSATAPTSAHEAERQARGRRAALRAGLFAAATTGVNGPLTYYAHTSNLDVPYLFWTSLALLALVRAVARVEPRRFRACAVYAVLAVGTKDQAYGVLLLGVPLTLVTWLLVDREARARVGELASQAGRALLFGAGLFLVTDAIVLNPTGFRARLHFLTGSASQDFAHYSADWTGRWDVLVDTFRAFDRYYPLFFAGLVVLGLVLVLAKARSSPRGLVLGLVPLFGAVSFTLLFNFVARRTEHRFLLPQMTLVSVYVALALGWLFDRLSGLGSDREAEGGPWAYGAVAGVLAYGAFGALDVDANLVLDPRYDAEAWMASHVKEGDTIEVHGLNVYLPRFPRGARVERVGPDPVAKRNPMAGIVEREDAYSRVGGRHPHFIVVSHGFVWRYLLDPHATDEHGRVLPPTQIASGSDVDATRFFQGLMRNSFGYHLAYTSTWTSKTWPRLDIHASTSRDIWIFERELPGSRPYGAPYW